MDSSQLTLCIETSSPRGSIALVRGTAVLAELVQEKPNAHAEELMPLLGRLLEQAGVERRSLERVAVGIGPGSFTGLRVGIALAQGISTGLGIDLVGVPSLTVLAAGLERKPQLEVYGALLDARRNEFFFAAFDAEHREVCSPRALPRQQVSANIAELLGDRPCCVAGEAALGVLPEAWLPPGGQAAYPEARHLAALCTVAGHGTEVTPLYLRDADAKLPNLPPNPIGGCEPR